MRRLPPQPRSRVPAWLRLLLISLASLVASLVLAPGFLTQLPASAQQAGYGQTMGNTQPERQFYDYGSSSPSSGSSGSSLLNSTNPMELMNKLRRSTALDDATSPSSAIDQALKDLEASSAAARPSGPSQTVKGP